MSKEFAYIRAFNNKFTIKKNNRNMRVTYEYYAKSNTQRKNLIARSDDKEDIQNIDLGNNEQAIKAFEEIADMSQAVLGYQNSSVDYIRDILKLNDSQIQKLDDFTPEQTRTLAERIAIAVTTDGDEDPKKRRQPRKKIN